MQAASRSSFQPAEAGAVLAGTLGVCAGGGALVGWAAGNTAYGVLGGVCVGLPAGVLAVYRRFKGYFS
jgi:F0F1-type ATP synthase assembly protein I